jgi:hypothetical protein
MLTLSVGSDEYIQLRSLHGDREPQETCVPDAVTRDFACDSDVRGGRTVVSMSDVDRRILDDAPTDSELHRWEADGQRRGYSNIVSWVDPDERYLLETTTDDSVQGDLIRLFRLIGYAEPRYSECRIAQGSDRQETD